MHAARRALPLALLTLLLAACGGGGGEQGAGTATPSGTAATTTGGTATAETTATSPAAEAAAYPADVRQNFLDACNRSSDGKRSACRCALAKLEATVSYEDFKQADAAIRGGGTAAPGTAKRIQDAISGCV